MEDKFETNAEKLKRLQEETKAVQQQLQDLKAFPHTFQDASNSVLWKSVLFFIASFLFLEFVIAAIESDMFDIKNNRSQSYHNGMVDEKPVIYLYPEQTMDVSVHLDFSGDLTCTYPAYEEGWKVTAEPDGTLTSSDGSKYNYLYWEGTSAESFDYSTGYCVKGSDTAEFLEWAFEEQGLTRKESNEFIVYWLPVMQNNPYNVISFQTKNYQEPAKLTITP